MYLSKKDIQSMQKVERLNLINSLSGIKPANLIGTKDKNGNENLAIFSSVIHLGSNPALFGFILRPQGDVRRHTHENIISTEMYTINFVTTDFMKNAHYTSAKFDAKTNEFEKSKLTPSYIKEFDAPFVKESPIKMGLRFVEEIPIKSNGTTLMVGQVEHIIMPDESMHDNGHLDLGFFNVAGISGLNTYYSLTKKDRFPYVRKNFKLEDLKID
ncbi:MAG: flavin reductase [Bacteroidia bacterium]|nr:flavin reductase [Bacteroidia bacterium]